MDYMTLASFTPSRTQIQYWTLRRGMLPRQLVANSLDDSRRSRIRRVGKSYY